MCIRDRTQPFRWEVQQHLDGTSTLRIFIYPFFYNAQTTAARFYQQHTFQVSYTQSQVSLFLIEQGPLGYGPGEETPALLWVENLGEPLDIVIGASVRPEGGGEAQGLLVRTLEDVHGLASAPLRWDTANAAPGGYAVEAEARTLDGELLDSAIVFFQVGQIAAETSGLTVTPATFAAGQALELAFNVRNAGAVPISGTATIQIYSHVSRQIVASLRQEFGPLAPAGNALIRSSWISPPDALGEYGITAYILYHGRSSEALKAIARAGRPMFMPLMRK